VTRARMTQIVNLARLAPDIQEEILFLAPTRGARDPVTIKQLQPIARELSWQRQREMWGRLKCELPALAAQPAAGHSERS